nr:AAA family ATPase [uncultured Sediminibacterium sp.]
MELIILTFISTYLLVWLLIRLPALYRRLMKHINSKRNKGQTQLFDHHFVEPKAFFLKEFNEIPAIAFIGHLDAGAVLTMINEKQFGEPVATYQRNYYNWKAARIEFTKTLVVMSDRMMISLGEDYAEILFCNRDYEKANNMILAFSKHKELEKEADFEINIITQSNYGLDLKSLAIQPTELDLDLYYNDDFKAVDAVIKERLSKENEKGIVLLHGLPGTGKTTYLRHLIGGLKKKVLFVSPGVAGNLMNPEFMDLLLDNPNAVLIIEDAENIIMDRRYSSQSSVSNLLNISDGLLSDCLNVQIICTFNSAVNMIDEALMRKGRLIARYEFGKLEIAKAQNLSNHLGLDQVISKPMTLAEITNPDENFHEAVHTSVIGFRRDAALVN